MHAVASDSKKLAYAAKTGNKWFVVVKALSGVVVNEVEGKQYDNIDYLCPISSVNFSPDGKHLAYSAKIKVEHSENKTQIADGPIRYGKKYEAFVVVDGVIADEKYDSISGPLFDNRNIIIFKALKNNQYYLVDGEII
jgi:hypothetical protein